MGDIMGLITSMCGGNEQAMQGSPTIHLVWKVPAGEDEAAVDAYWKKHETWMRESHQFGSNGDEPRILSYTISKGKELENPLDSASKETGMILYVMSEIYVA